MKTHASVQKTRRQGAHVEQMQRRRMLLALGELLGENGLENASVGAICTRAGVSRRTFYEAFGDREECFLAALEQTTEQIHHEIAPAYHTTHRWSIRIHATVTILLEHFDANPHTAHMCIIDTLRGGPKIQQYRQHILTILATAVDQGRDQAKRGNGPLPLTAEGVVGGALAVIHTRLSQTNHPPLASLANPLTGMIVHPYLGTAHARRELDRPAPKRPTTTTNNDTKDPFKDITIRFTYRTARVLATIAADPGASNRLIAETSGITDEGQTSRLLRRLHNAGLIENHNQGQTRGEPNAWQLTKRGQTIHTTLTGTQTKPE